MLRLITLITLFGTLASLGGCTPETTTSTSADFSGSSDYSGSSSYYEPNPGMPIGSDTDSSSCYCSCDCHGSSGLCLAFSASPYYRSRSCPVGIRITTDRDLRDYRSINSSHTGRCSGWYLKKEKTQGLVNYLLGLTKVPGAYYG